MYFQYQPHENKHTRLPRHTYTRTLIQTHTNTHTHTHTHTHTQRNREEKRKRDTQAGSRNEILKKRTHNNIMRTKTNTLPDNNRKRADNTTDQQNNGKH